MIEIEQDDDIASVLDQPLGLFDHHLGDLNVPHRGFVKGRRHNLAVHRALHVRHFFRPLVDQKHDQIAFRMIGGNRLGNVLQEHRLAGARRRDNQGALALADRRNDIDDARRQILSSRILNFELQALVGIERGQVVEMDLVPGLLRVLEVDRVAFEQREIPFSLLGASDDALDRIAGSEPEPPDLRRGHVNVVWAWKIVGVGRSQEGESVLQNLDHALANNLNLDTGELLEDREHQLLLAHDRRIFDVVLLRKRQELGWRFLL